MFARSALASLFVLLMALVPAAFAGKTELTTYYPSAYGEYINLTSTADSYFATASGNVSIGTTFSSAKLHIQAGGGVATTYSDINIGGRGGWASGEEHTINAVHTGGKVGSIIFRYDATNGGAIRFGNFYNGGESSAISMTINANGNVGIGTTGPNARLQVFGGGSGAAPATSGAVDATMNFRAGRGAVSVDVGMMDTGVGYIQNRNIADFSSNYDLSLQPNGGAVGIGTTSPSYKLDIVGDQAANYIARIKNSNATNTAKGLIIDLGIANASRTVATRFIDFAGAGVVAGKITGGASTVAYTTVLADFAEYFRADPKNMPQPGELVELDPSGAQSVQRSGGDASRVLVGVVSSSPAFVGNGPLCKVEDADCDANFAKYNALVALVGQVSVKVNTSRGPIAIADPIAASDTPGEGAKAIGAGHIVGYAQESLASGNGTIKVLIRPQYYYNPQSKA